MHDEAERTHASVDDASTSVVLVLKTRTDQVKDYMDEHYGNLRSTRSRRTTGSMNAWGAGSRAGRNANTSTTGIGGPRGSLRG